MAIKNVALKQAPRPPTVPGITQDQQDRIRDGVEAGVGTVESEMDLSGLIDPFAGEDARSPEPEPAAGGTGNRKPPASCRDGLDVLPEEDPNDARALISRIARIEAAKGRAYLRNQLKGGQLDAYDAAIQSGEYGKASRWLGHAVHQATATQLQKRFDDRFSYNPSNGVDFTDNLTGEKIELTTVGQVDRHKAKGRKAKGENYATAPYATYCLPSR